MTEFELLARILPTLPTHEQVRLGAGHDCAVLELGSPAHQFLFKTDAVVEGVHFTPSTPPEKVGRKALARPLSDLAAMAGTPVACLVTLGLPEKFEPDWVTQFYQGLNQLARAQGVAVAGGELTRSTSGVFVSIAVLGTIPHGPALTRAGARPGDAIFVTGELGGSLAGRHLDFEPRLAEARWLAQHFRPHAMMDLSDGLAGDLRHILDASQVGAELLSSAIPVSRAARLQAQAGSAAKPALLAALTDGEDFELLFTLPSARAVPLLDAWHGEFPGLKISCIGKITAAPGLRLRAQEGLRELSLHGYTHFAQS